MLSEGAARAALDAFAALLDERWSYRRANNADFPGAITALRKRITGGMSSDDLGIALQTILALGIDGHSKVSGYRLPQGGSLPFLVEPAGDRFVAVTADRAAFLADGFPFLTRIDGREMSAWCAAAAALVPKGSPQYVTVRCLRLLREIDYWRGRLDLPRKTTVEVELTDQGRRAHRVVTLPVAPAPLNYGVWPPGGSRLLENDIGYLRLKSLVKEPSLAEIKEWMPRFRDTVGLIVDVRDNDGGDRDALMALYSYVAAPSDPPHVFNAAAYRLYPTHPADYLATNHRMYRDGASEWTPPERRAVAEFARAFRPRWMPPKGQFSDWHYMALSRIEEPGRYHYDRPVFVLLNGRSFSATDIFLAGLKGMKGVTLLGTPSSGGSAYTEEFPLGATPLRLRIGSMASFQADGRLFDGQGIQPDILLQPVPEFYIGAQDNVLEEAVRRIRAAGRRAS